MQHGLGGVDFEFEIKSRFEALGWQVETTSISGDFGADLLVRCGQEVLVVQCKDYGSPVGISAVQEAHFARSHYSATEAAVVARCGFTKAAIRGAATARVQMLRPDDIGGGSPFDRTRHRAEFDRQRQRKYEAIQLAIERERKWWIWQRYDRSMSRYKSRHWRWSVPVAAVAVFWIIGATVKDWKTLTYREAALFAFFKVFAVSVIWALGRPRSPRTPEFRRRGWIATCAACTRKLRVDFGKEGSVRCPHCKHLTKIGRPPPRVSNGWGETYSDQTHREGQHSGHPADASFFDT